MFETRNTKRGRGCSLVMRCMFSMPEALGSTPSPKLSLKQTQDVCLPAVYVMDNLRLLIKYLGVKCYAQELGVCAALWASECAGDQSP